MTAVPERVLNWLYSVLTNEYHDVNRTYSDVAAILSQYPSLSPRTEVYTYENGASALLLLISGTIPASFRGTTFRYPVALWIPHAYPKEPPIVYVTPAKGMLVRPGQHVAGDGRVYHPYLAQWGKYWDKSSLFDFVAVLRGVFTKEPPVRTAQQPPTSLPAQQAPPPVPPPPEEWRRSQQPVHAGSPSQAPRPPPKPPKPGESADSHDPGHSERRAPAQNGPPLPPLPPQLADGKQGLNNSWQQDAHRRQAQHAPQQFPQRQVSRDSGPSPLTPQAQHPQAPHRQIRPQQFELESPVSPITPVGQSQIPPPRYQQAPQPPHPPQDHRPPQAYPSGNLFYQDTAVRQHPAPPYPPQPYQQHQPNHPHSHPQPTPKPAAPPPDLLTSPLDVTLPSQAGTSAALPAPPIPPNPEKDALLTALNTTLSDLLRSTLTSNAAALPLLHAQHAALLAAQARLQSELEQLAQLDAALDTDERVLGEAMREADRVMEEARHRRRPEVDEVLVAPTVVGAQLYGLVAEERAVVEARGVLRRGVERGTVGWEGFVKQTRALAREEFLKKALIRKIARGMGLDEEVRR